MNSQFLEEMNKEFREFMNSDSKAPPRRLQEQIFKRVHEDLNPNAWYLFSKMALIHFFVGLVTLSLCPQFGIRVFGEGLGLMKYFSHFGLYGCMAICGAFFIGSSFLVGALALRPEEIRALRKHRALQIAGLIFLSLGALLMANAEILLSFASAWMLGSFLGGFAMLEFGFALRKRLHTFS